MQPALDRKKSSSHTLLAWPQGDKSQARLALPYIESKALPCEVKGTEY